jgi:class 3 adenylate cyclase
MFDDLADGAVRETDCLVAFYDITGFMTYAKGRSPAEVLALCAGYFELTGAILEDAGGRLIKTLGDEGLCVFEDADIGVAALRQVQHVGDDWLRDQGWSGRAVVKAHWGTVAFGFVGAPGGKRLDVYGDTVNTAAVLNAREPGFAMTPQVFRQLSADGRKAFKKHTPPVTYIPAAARQRPAPQYDRPA